MNAQQLIASVPEFHSIGTVKKTGMPAQLPKSRRPQKSAVYVLLNCGYDSFNMLVPHTCAQTNAEGKPSRESMRTERGVLAFTDEERSQIITAVG